MFGLGKKILIVDDEPDLADAVGAFLRSWGKISVSKVSCVKEAIEELNAGGVDLVITDISMYQNSGYELIEHMQDNFPAIPVILMSGKVNIYDDGDAPQSVFKNIYAFFEKPFDFALLKDTVNEALEKGNSQKKRAA